MNSLTPNDTQPNITHIFNHLRLEDLSYFYLPLVGPNGLIYRWDLVLYYIGIRAIQGVGSPSSGLLGALQSQLWISVDQYSSRVLGIHLFEHIHKYAYFCISAETL